MKKAVEKLCEKCNIFFAYPPYKQCFRCNPDLEWVKSNKAKDEGM